MYSTDIRRAFIIACSLKLVLSAGFSLDSTGHDYGRQLCKFFILKAFFLPNEHTAMEETGTHKLSAVLRVCFFCLFQGGFVIQPDQMQVRLLALFIWPVVIHGSVWGIYSLMTP